MLLHHKTPSIYPQQEDNLFTRHSTPILIYHKSCFSFTGILNQPSLKSLHDEGFGGSGVRVDTTQDVPVVAKVADPVRAQFGVRSDLPQELGVAEAQDRRLTFPLESEMIYLI